MVMVPVRGPAAGFAARLYRTWPSPVPLAPAVTEIQLAPLVAVQAQPVSLITLTLALVGDKTAFPVVAESVALQLPSRVRLARARPPVSRQKRLCHLQRSFWSCSSWLSPTTSDFRLTTNVGTRKRRGWPLYAGVRAPFAA